MEEINKMPVKWHIISELKKFFAFDQKAIQKILDTIECDSNTREEFLAKLNNPQTLYNINKIYKFLSNYHNKSIKEDFTSFFNTLPDTGLTENFYIYFIYFYYIKREGIIQKNNQLKSNISSLFFEKDTEVEFNKSKFRTHFRKHYVPKEYLNKPLDEQLLEEIKKEIPVSASELEIAITIYILLCQKFRYSVQYIIEKDLAKITPYWQVSPENNDIICSTFSIIYYKLLKLFGIDANLSGDYKIHMKVELRISSMMLEADATNFGFDYTNEYKISDLASVRFGFSLNGFSLATTNYSDYEYVKHNQKRLEEHMLKIYKRIYSSNKTPLEVSSIIYNRALTFKKLKNSNSLTLEDEIAYQMETLNQIKHFQVEDSECESKQFFSKFSHKLLSSYQPYLKEIFLLYQKEENQTHLYSLYMFTIDEVVTYYLETSEGLIKCDESTILEELSKRNVQFKNKKDLERINKSIHKNNKAKKKTL